MIDIDKIEPNGFMPDENFSFAGPAGFVRFPF
jgi:hypothetical protein